jgi:hypothetical protein
MTKHAVEAGHLFKGRGGVASALVFPVRSGSRQSAVRPRLCFLERHNTWYARHDVTICLDSNSSTQVARRERRKKLRRSQQGCIRSRGRSVACSERTRASKTGWPLRLRARKSLASASRESLLPNPARRAAIVARNQPEMRVRRERKLHC